MHNKFAGKGLILSHYFNRHLILCLTFMPTIILSEMFFVNGEKMNEHISYPPPHFHSQL